MTEFDPETREAIREEMQEAQKAILGEISEATDDAVRDIALPTKADEGGTGGTETNPLEVQQKLVEVVSELTESVNDLQDQLEEIEQYDSDETNPRGFQ